MSGGSMNYFYSTLDEYADALHDPELDEMMTDIVNLYHDREWYDSGDISEGNWIQSMMAFKKKWFETTASDRFSKIMTKKNKEALKSFGIYDKCGECKHWEKKDKGANCNLHPFSPSDYDVACEKFEMKEEDDD